MKPTQERDMLARAATLDQAAEIVRAMIDAREEDGAYDSDWAHAVAVIETPPTTFGSYISEINSHERSATSSKRRSH
jgi:hypothetical protein